MFTQNDIFKFTKERFKHETLRVTWSVNNRCEKKDMDYVSICVFEEISLNVHD